MKILVINPIIYTSETKKILRAKSIKDTMIYDLCLAFSELRHTVTLFTAEPYKPIDQELYPFEVIWGKCVGQKLFMPHCFPLIPELIKYLNLHKKSFDLIISSEVFSMHSLMAVLCANKKLIIWHELAKHNALMWKIPSKVWYKFITKLFLQKTKIIARSEEAYRFISRYSNNVDTDIIEHGVNLHKFVPSERKENYFVVCSQLISRKRISGIIYSFKVFLSQYNSSYRLYIIGEGEERKKLINLAQRLEISDSVIFTGKMNHQKLLPYLAHAKALLVNTEKDNSMISIIESIAVGTPILTTDVPLNARYIKSHELGMAKEWSSEDLVQIVEKNVKYVQNCLAYREELSAIEKARKFIEKANMF